ncbi:MAG: ANTAR domain-containing protein [Clostridia bacterium]|nr:ANTAR domain-containing protein [Clostridia bacterium]
MPATSYRVLLVSSSEKLNGHLRPLLYEHSCESVEIITDASGARRKILESPFDFVIINAPLPDEFGTKLALDIGSETSMGVLLFVRAESFMETNSRLSPLGILTLAKPASSASVIQSLCLLQATVERLRRMERHTANLEEKMEEIRLVNRAKWLLIEKLGMTEPSAHRYIEKTAMDRCVTKRSVAQSIIKTYQT